MRRANLSNRSYKGGTECHQKTKLNLVPRLCNKTPNLTVRDLILVILMIL